MAAVLSKRCFEFWLLLRPFRPLDLSNLASGLVELEVGLRTSISVLVLDIVSAERIDFIHVHIGEVLLHAVEVSLLCRVAVMVHNAHDLLTGSLDCGVEFLATEANPVLQNRILSYIIECCATESNSSLQC